MAESEGTKQGKLLSDVEMLTAAEVRALVSAEQSRATDKETMLDTAIGTDGFFKTKDVTFDGKKTYYLITPEGKYDVATVVAGEEVTAGLYYEKHTVHERLCALEKAYAELATDHAELKQSVRTLLTGIAEFVSVDKLPDVYTGNQVRDKVNALIEALGNLKQ